MDKIPDINKFKGLNNVHIPLVENIKKINYQYKKIINTINKCTTINDKTLKPSLISEFNKDLQIKPFWNNKIQLLSDKLYLPSSDNLVEANFNHEVFNSDSWFNIEHYINTDKPYKLQFKDVKETIKEITKVSQIKLFLTNEQKEYMKIIIGTYRYFYNRGVAYLNNYNKTTKKSWYLVDPKDSKTKKTVKIIGKDNPYTFITMKKYIKDNYPSWILIDFPSHLVDEAFRECSARFLTCLNQCRTNNKPFDFSFKTKKEIVQTMNLERPMINSKSNGIFVKWMINGKYIFKNIKTHDKFSNYEFKGSSLSYHSVLNSFTLNLTYKIQSEPTKIKNICAIDQGIRTPFTIYSTNEVVKIGFGASEKIIKVCKEIDIIQSRINSETYYVKDKDGKKKYYKVTSGRKKSLRKAMHRKIKYLKNLKRELHNKSIRYLCDNYSTIIVPPFKTQAMVKTLNSKVSRMMCTFSFYEFKTKLINKAQEYNINIIEKCEPYTSKTCGNCGIINYGLGTSEVYKCTNCDLEIDRDINGSRCILLRNLKCC